MILYYYHCDTLKCAQIKTLPYRADMPRSKCLDAYLDA